MSIEVPAPRSPGMSDVLTPAALAFLAELAAPVPRSAGLDPAAPVERQAQIDAGPSLDFLPETAAIRDGRLRGAVADAS